MNSFVELREKIDALVEESKYWITKKSISESMNRIDKINELLARMRPLAISDIQKRVVNNRFNEIENL